jgi:hypothetical protein
LIVLYKNYHYEKGLVAPALLNKRRIKMNKRITINLYKVNVKCEICERSWGIRAATLDELLKKIDDAYCFACVNEYILETQKEKEESEDEENTVVIHTSTR